MVRNGNICSMWNRLELHLRAVVILAALILAAEWVDPTLRNALHPTPLLEAFVIVLGELMIVFGVSAHRRAYGRE
jgi:hypothetical protein